ncbi:MAG: SpoIID/LytB domain-containing protein [Defluviitaleaceae bacterium]|nr:SpoIID/LytB domain-containing protein [Defluviitaleaceae bacterium]
MSKYIEKISPRKVFAKLSRRVSLADSILLFCLLLVFTACGRGEIGGPLPILYFDEARGFSWYYVPDLPSAPGNIRVVIGTTNFTGLVHESVEISSDSMFFVQSGNDTFRFEPGEIFHGAEIEGERVVISAGDADGRLEIRSIARNHPNGAAPSYRGTLEVSQVDGGFIIVNELPIEHYLYAVVPSEMPSSFGVEASKVQAVTARSFALHQMRQSAFRAYGAHVDDSVISQVYNNLPENEISIEAVRATRNRVLTHNGEIILANYFSTSGGTTANFGEVWAVGAEFPSATPEFLRARGQVFAPIAGDLRTEAAASAFFRNTEIAGVDENFPWFRWQVTMTTEEISERINANLAARQAANPALIHVIDANNNPTDARAVSIGTLTHLQVTRRGQGGNIMEMHFYGTESDVRVQTEFNIRALLNPGTIPVTRRDGTTTQNSTLLPSAFFTMELYSEKSPLLAVTFYGGGNGHGVGMSQNGVRALLDMGLNYAQILYHYYPGTEILYIPGGLW